MSQPPSPLRVVDPNAQGACRKCGRPFNQVPRFYSRLLCWDCGLAAQRKKAGALRRRSFTGVYPLGKRNADMADLEKITGIARLLRERRIARYQRCVERGQPIEYEPCDTL